jgi:ATP-dependent Zn protease
MEGGTSMFASLLYSWAPVILLIGFWIFFMRRMRGGKQGGYFDRRVVHMERQEQLLERIAAALEKRNTNRE